MTYVIQEIQSVVAENSLIMGNIPVSGSSTSNNLAEVYLQGKKNYVFKSRVGQVRPPSC